MLIGLDKDVNLNEQDCCDNVEMTLQERINDLLNGPPKKKAIDLARYAGISRATVSAWVNGKTLAMDGETAFKVARFFTVNAEWVLSGKGKKTIPIAGRSSSYSVDMLSTWDSSTPLRDDEVELPFFREIELSAGSGRYEVIENHGNKLRFAKSTLQKQGVFSDKAACVTVSGSSMEPVLPDKSVVGIDTGDKNIKDGKMYALDHSGNLRVKLAYKLPGGGLRLRSWNKEEYPDEVFNEIESKEIIILGRVFWSSVLW